MCIRSYKALVVFSLKQHRLEAGDRGRDVVLGQVHVGSGSCLALAEGKGKSSAASVRPIGKELSET